MARRFLLLFVLIGLTAVASATKIQVGDPECTGDDIIIHDGDQIQYTVQNGGGTFGFCNETSSDWKTLLVAIQTTVPVEDITCNTEGNVFLPCKLYTTDTPNLVYAWFETCDNLDTPCNITYTGVSINNHLIIDMNCPDDGCKGPPFDWPDDTHGTGFTNIPGDGHGNPLFLPPVPEPATATLLTAGLMAAYIRRKRQP
jgi:hypothetical protein